MNGLFQSRFKLRKKIESAAKAKEFPERAVEFGRRGRREHSNLLSL